MCRSSLIQSGSVIVLMLLLALSNSNRGSAYAKATARQVSRIPAMDQAKGGPGSRGQRTDVRDQRSDGRRQDMVWAQSGHGIHLGYILLPRRADTVVASLCLPSR